MDHKDTAGAPESAKYKPASNQVATMALVLGPDALAAAANTVDEGLKTRWPEGAILAGSTVLPPFWPKLVPPGVIDEYPSELIWDALNLIWGEVELAVGPTSLTLTLRISLEGPTEVLSTAGIGCEGDLVVKKATLTLPLALERGPDGVLQAIVPGPAALTAKGMTLDLSGCLPLEGTDLPDALKFNDIKSLVLDSLADDLTDWLAPVLRTVVPDALRADASMTASMQVGDPTGYGDGQISATVIPPMDALVSVVDGHLLFPFSTLLDAIPHACAPDFELTPIQPSALPSLAGIRGGGLMIHESIISRAIDALWTSGALCGERATRQIRIPAGALAAHWQALSDLDEDAELLLRLWPSEAPQTVLEGDETRALLRLNTGQLRVEVIAKRHGAELVVGSLLLAMEVLGDLRVGDAGAAQISVVEVSVAGAKGIAGLFSAPTEATIHALAPTIARALIEDRPLVPLPPIPGDGALTARIAGRYLVFATALMGGI